MRAENEIQLKKIFYRDNIQSKKLCKVCKLDNFSTFFERRANYESI